MDNSKIKITRIVYEIEQLDYKDKINILSRIVNQLKREEKTHQQERAITQVTPELIQLKGLGKTEWRKTDVASFISTERESWD
jgi:YesN/AraC family two-component response regulator